MKKIWLVALVYWLVMSTLCVWLYPCLISDTMSRYAPMADALSRGDFFYAFHPRFCVLFSSLSGAVRYLTGLDGACSCQIVSFGFFSLSAVAVFALFRRVFGDGRVAWLGAALTLVNAECFVFALDGLRDPCRTLALALCALTFVGSAPWVLGLGLFLLVTLRTDLFLISGAILFAWCVWRLYLRDIKGMVLPIGFWSLGAAFEMYMTYVYTGYFLPGAQFIGIYQKLLGGAL